MRTLRQILPLLALLLAIAAGACSTDETVIGNNPATNSNDISEKDTLNGGIRGTMKAGKTYYLNGDITVKAGDSLLIQPGVNIVDLANNTIYIRGALIATGSRDQMITFGPDGGRQTPGAWGGIELDSPSVAIMKYCRVFYGCGVRPTGIARPSVYFFSNRANTTQFIMEDCEVSYTKDDAVQLNGGRGHIIRSTFRMNGVVEGSGVNFKLGFTGDVAYNYIWSSNDHAIRAITSTTVLFPQTNVNIYNNTIVNFGGKNVSRPGAGILIDQNTRANVYNNIIVNGRIGLQVTAAADTANTHYGNNLFYATVDSLRQYFYPSNHIGRPQPTDRIQADPKFVAFDPNINANTDNNDPHLQAGSPAIGAGNPTYDQDLGAFTAKR
jgi:hypothetical protein